MIWKILGIEKTKDEDKIRKAYHDKLRDVNPEDDQEGFKELRRAYEEAMDYAGMPEKSESDSDGEKVFSGKKKNEVDLWIDRIDAIYSDVRLRRDEKVWKDILNDPLCDDLDTELEAGEKLLVYIMSHSYLPQNICKMINKRFNYTDAVEQLKEKFPDNYIRYFIWQIDHQTFIDYDLFDGDTKADVDEYINKIYEIKTAEEEYDLEKIERLLKELSRYDITHPFAEVERARYLLMKAGDLDEFLMKPEENGLSEDDKAEYRKQALDIMDELDFEYSSNMYIHRMYAEALMENRQEDKAKEIFEELKEADAANYGALIGLAKCSILSGNMEYAKEQLEDILEERVQDVDSLSLLDVVNISLVEQYQKQLADDMDMQICIKLGWCYYQQREFDKGIKLLDQLGESNEYDYVNLRCRLYLAADDYEKAYIWTRKWLDLIKQTEDDGSRESEKRKNRLSLAHFSLGVCIWENDVIDDHRIKDKDAYNKAISYINASIDEENNILVKLSYMEQLARFYLVSRQYEKCVDQCSAIIEKDAGFFPAYVHRQRANYELRNAKEVIDDYFSCTEIYPEYVHPYLLAAEVFFAFDQYDDVEQVIKTAEEAKIESDGIELYKIRLLHYREFSKENLEKALTEIIKLREKMANRTEDDPTDIEKPEDVDRELALIYWDMDRTDEALSVLDECLEKYNDNTTILNLKVDILNRSGRSGEALEICKHLYMKEMNAYNGTRLGVCYERLEQYDEAIKQYKAAYNKDPEYHVVVRRLMYLYSFLSDRRRDLDLCRTAIHYATEYIELTNSAEGYVERGNLYIDLYELEKAVDDCKKAIELDPEAYYAYNNLGCALLKLRRLNEAIPPLVSAIKIDEKKDHLPYLNLAEVYTVMGNYRQAIDEYKYMLEAFPKHTYVRKDIAKLHCRMGEYGKAIAYYSKEIERKRNKLNSFSAIKRLAKKGEHMDIENELMRLLCELADVYRQAGDYESAERNYGIVLRRWGNVVYPRISVKPILKIIEYYRDKGDLSKARSLLKKIYMRVDNDEMQSRVSEDIHFDEATVYYELGDMSNARLKGRVWLTLLEKYKGSIDEALSDARYRPANLYNIGIIKLCMGEIDEAKKYISQIIDCHQCVICEHSGCFEYYFGMGLIAEAEGRKEEAVKLYEKAIELKVDYPCAKRHLDMCRQ